MGKSHRKSQMKNPLNPSRFNLNNWLEAVSRGVTPDGSRTEVMRVQPEEVVEIVTSGGQSFGSGGYHASASSVGEVEMVEDLPSESTQFVWKHRASFRMRGPAIIHAYSGDSIGNGRSWRMTYYCATDEQMADAVRQIAQEKRAESANANLQLLREQLFKKWLEEAEHYRKSHRNGCCLAGLSSVEIHARFDTAAEHQACHQGTLDETRLSRMDTEVARAVRRVAFMPEAERLAFWKDTLSAFQEQCKKEGREFARGVRESLARMGFTAQAVRAIIGAAGPGRALAAVQWAYSALDAAQGNPDALDVVLGNIRGTHGFGRDRMVGVLESLGLPVPSVSNSGELSAILRGAHAAVMSGLPERSAGESIA